jgi:yecA family protein
VYDNGIIINGTDRSAPTKAQEGSHVLQRRFRATSHRRAEPAALLPPNLRELGALPFTPTDREALREWLTQGGWPRGQMELAVLEGYLIALLVWPVGVMPGAWLPPIWGEQGGWRVPPKIGESETYVRFTGLVVGFLQELDRGLNASPPRFAPTLSEVTPPLRGRPAPGIPWAQGFLRALQQNLQGLTWRTTAARSAVECIARYASHATTTAATDPKIARDLAEAVLALAAERPSRGPLGVLETSGTSPGGTTAHARVKAMRTPHPLKTAIDGFEPQQVSPLASPAEIEQRQT